MAALYFFTGENEYVLRLEKHKWMQEFIQKHGADNLLLLDGATLVFRALLDEVSVAPFIAAKRLVIINGMPKFSKEEIESLERDMHEDTILVISDPKPDKRLAGTKSLLATATVKEFPVLSGNALQSWVQSQITAGGKAIDPAALTLLLLRVGDNQDMLYQEVAKLTLGVVAERITARDVERLTLASAEQEVWTLTNLLAGGKREEALVFASSLLDRGEDAFSVWAILLWMLKNLVATVAAVDEGKRNPAVIASEYGVPFPSAKTLLPCAQGIRIASLGTFVAWAAETDIALKTGGYRATQEFPQEVRALIDRFVIGFSTLVH